MKKIIAALCGAIMIISLSACAGNGQPEASATSSPDETPSASTGSVLTLSPYSDADFGTSEDVVIETEFEVYGSDAPWVSYTITNRTSEALMYGEEFAVEVSKDGQWYQVLFPENTAWHAIAYFLKANDTRADSFSFSFLNYRFTDGQYRLIKEIGGKRYFGVFNVSSQSPITAVTPFRYQALEKLSKDYSGEAAAVNGDVVITFGGTENIDRLYEFVDKASLGMAAMVRIVQYTDEGDPLITDVIYKQDQKDCFLYRMDNSRDTFGGSDIGITETVYSYLITDGEALYLSNCAGWELNGAYSTEPPVRIASMANSTDIAVLIVTVEKMTEERLRWNETQYKAHSPSGDKSVNLTGDLTNDAVKEKLSYYYEEPGSGEMRFVSDPDDSAKEIISAFWLDEETYILICNTTGSFTYFHAVGAAESGYGTGYTITDGVFKITK